MDKDYNKREEPAIESPDKKPDIEISDEKQVTLNNENNMSNRRTHLRKAVEKKSKTTFIFTTFSLIIIILLIIFFGPTILINFSVLLSNIQSNKIENKNNIKEQEYIAPPVLDPIPDATSSANIKVTGEITEINNQIKLYVNDDLQDIITPDKSIFSFDNVSLKEGDNIIKAIVAKDNQNSNDSNILNIKYIKDKPKLEIEEPEDGVSLKGGDKNISVKGKTNPDVTITINGFMAVTKSDGSFNYLLPINDGDNNIKIVAKNEAGSTNEKEIKINYSQ